MWFHCYKKQSEKGLNHFISAVFYKDGDKIYINGSPVEDGFDLNGVNLDKYDIKIKNDTVYLMSK